MTTIEHLSETSSAQLADKQNQSGFNLSHETYNFDPSTVMPVSSGYPYSRFYGDVCMDSTFDGPANPRDTSLMVTQGDTRVVHTHNNNPGDAYERAYQGSYIVPLDYMDQPAVDDLLYDGGSEEVYTALPTGYAMSAVSTDLSTHGGLKSMGANPETAMLAAGNAIPETNASKMGQALGLHYTVNKQDRGDGIVKAARKNFMQSLSSSQTLASRT